MNAPRSESASPLRIPAFDAILAAKGRIDAKRRLDEQTACEKLGQLLLAAESRPDTTDDKKAA